MHRLYRNWALRSSLVAGATTLLLATAGAQSTDAGTTLLHSNATPLAPCFSDTDWHQLQNALVYVWSPRMVLSATQASLAFHAAKSHGLQFIPLVDGRLPDAEWRAALVQLKAGDLSASSLRQPSGAASSIESAIALGPTQRLCSPQLIIHNAYRHFPSSFVVTGAVPHRYPIVGAMPETFWMQAIGLRLHNDPP